MSGFALAESAGYISLPTAIRDELKPMLELLLSILCVCGFAVYVATMLLIHSERSKKKSANPSKKVTVEVTMDRELAKKLVNEAKKKQKKPKKKKPKPKPEKKVKLEPQKPTVPECALGKGFGYLRTLDKHDIISDKCHNDCPRKVREACLDQRKAEKLLKEMKI